MAKRKGPTPKRKVQPPKAPPKTRRLTGPVLVAVAALGVALVGLAAVLVRGGDGGDDRAVPEAADEGPVHVHGLGINPADGSLLIATHTGTYRVPRDASSAKRIGDSRQDTMGFTVAGPDHFLGSGHPDVEEAVAQDLPPHLGLIESRDAGRTWTPISLLGEADFHVLRVVGRRVYGYDASNDRLLVSRDMGETWRQATRPAPLVDLAVDPANGRRVVATAEGGVYVSADEGRAWTRVAPRIGLVAWPSRDRLYLVDGDGTVFRSSDAGREWTKVGDVGGTPAALYAHSAAELYVALHDGAIMQSRDGGRRWTVRSTP